MKTGTALRRVLLLLTVTTLLPCGSAPAGEAAVPDGGADIVDRKAGAFSYWGKKGLASLETVAAEGMPFPRALRVTAKKRVANFWQCQLMAHTDAPVRKGDTCLLTFYARTLHSRDETGEGRITCYFQRNGPDYRKSLMLERHVPTRWKRFFLPFRCAETYKAGGAQLGFGVGMTEQTVEIAGVRVLGYGTRVRLEDLPRTREPRPWMAPDAPWRTAAARRIEEHRKGNLMVRVNDATGKPVPGATVTVAMKRHAFGFGSAVSIPGMFSRDTPAYKKTILKIFNRAGNENTLKWEPWEGEWGREYSRERTIETFRWFRENGLETHGHVLVWPSWRYMPKRCQALKGDKEALRKCVEDRVRDTVTTMKGLVDEWDVVNEPFSNHDLMDIFGRGIMIDWFKIARAADPAAKLMINDYGILTGGKGDTAHRRHYEETIQFLLDGGAPLDMIGLQGHFGGSPTDPETLLQILDRFARFGLPLQVTEFDINTDDIQLLAGYTEILLTVAFSHPAVADVTMWGFWEKRHWRPQAAMYRTNWEIRPNGEAFKRLVFDEWWTRKTATTGADGRTSVRGFCGTYEIAVSAGGRTKTLETELDNAGRTATVVLE